ncbi:MAG: hypothetical protein JWN48_1362 [Myxococcaceae bacterium]|nr:hypothetical protein [Myxococcaceae bacterium]
MSVSSPALRPSTHSIARALQGARRWRRLARWALLCCAWLVSSCSNELAESVRPDESPCGRGKARSCSCDDGQKGIAQCLAGGDWGECWCGDDGASEADGGQDGTADKSADAGPASAWTDVPKSHLACARPFDLRAHSASGRADPYLIHGSAELGLGGEQTVCFYFKPPYPDAAQALAFVALPDAVSRPSSWLLHGIDATAHQDGEVVPCAAAEPGAYPLASFAPGSADVSLPSGVALDLPSGPTSALILEVHYGPQGPSELLDHTGVRLCTSAAGEVEHTAAVHFTGTDAVCIPPAAVDFEISGVCSPQLDRGSIHLLSVRPRTLALGTHMLMEIKRADGSREPLFDQPNEGPLQVQYLDGVTLEPGDELETHCFYDNPGLLSAPFGSDATDALCYGFVSAWPAGALSTTRSKLDPWSSLTSGMQPPNRCLDPIGILGACL